MIVNFKDVGSPPQSWSEDLPDVEHATMVRSIRKHNALRSRGIDFSFDEEKQEGIVWVGDVRPVGTFTIEDKYVVMIDPVAETLRPEIEATQQFIKETDARIHREP